MRNENSIHHCHGSESLGAHLGELGTLVAVVHSREHAARQQQRNLRENGFSGAPASQFLWGTDASLGKVERQIFELRGLGANRRLVGERDLCLVRGRSRPALRGAEALVASMEDLTKQERNGTIERACHEYHTVGSHFARFNAAKLCGFVPP